MRGRDPAGGLEAVHAAHPHVHQDHVRPPPLGHLDGRLAVRALADHRDLAVAGQDHLDAFADRRVIVHDQAREPVPSTRSSARSASWLELIRTPMVVRKGTIGNTLPYNRPRVNRTTHRADLAAGRARADGGRRSSVGLATSSLGILAEAVHSGLDAAAALLSLYAIGVAERPADAQHQYGHGKAQHLAALSESVFLAAVRLLDRRRGGHAASLRRRGGGGALVRLRAAGWRAGRGCGARRTVSLRHGPPGAKRRPAGQRAALRLRLRGHVGGDRRAGTGRRRLSARRRGRRPGGGGAGAGGGGADGRAQRGRVDGPRTERPQRPDRGRRGRGAGSGRGALGARPRGGRRELRRRRDRRVPAGGPGAQPPDDGPGRGRGAGR